MDVEPETQRSEGACLRSHSKSVVELELEPTVHILRPLLSPLLPSPAGFGGKNEEWREGGGREDGITAASAPAAWHPPRRTLLELLKSCPWFLHVKVKDLQHLEQQVRRQDPLGGLRIQEKSGSRVCTFDLPPSSGQAHV